MTPPAEEGRPAAPAPVEKRASRGIGTREVVLLTTASIEICRCGLPVA